MLFFTPTQVIVLEVRQMAMKYLDAVLQFTKDADLRPIILTRWSTGSTGSTSGGQLDHQMLHS